MVQWLGCGTFTAIAWVQPLFREIRSHKPLSTAKKKKKKTNNEVSQLREWPKYRTLTIPNAGKDVERLLLLLSQLFLVEMQNGAATLEKSGCCC